MAPSPLAIGIDLGTTFSCVAIYKDGEVRIIPNLDDGQEITPSYVFIDIDGSEVVGSPAKLNAFKYPENTIFDVKRILGRKFTDSDLQNDMKFWPFTVQEHEGVPKVLANGELFHPEEISAKVLAKLRSFAEGFLQLSPGSIKKAVITVPAYFNDGQRQATMDAGELAGFDLVSILNEPTAAAIAYYNKEKMTSKPKTILVFDLGGGTFDVAVLEMQRKKIDILGVSGDAHLGGEDFDKKMMEYCVSSFKAETGIDLLAGKDDPNHQVMTKARRILRRLQTDCEKAKGYLTSGQKKRIVVDAIVSGRDLIVEITRQEFEDMNKSYFDRTIEIVDATLNQVGVAKKGIDEILLVGGSTRIPKIQQLLRDYFGGKVLNKSIHPDQAVAHGAAIQAAMVSEEKSWFGGGASSELKLNQIQDVTPMAVGIGVVDDELAVMIPQNTKIPTKKTQRFCSTEDDQKFGNFPIYQGNDLEVASNNNLLGTLRLDDLPQSKAGKLVVDVKMKINEMGIIQVTALCKSSGQKVSMTIMEHANRMSPHTKERLVSQVRGHRLEK